MIRINLVQISFYFLVQISILFYINSVSAWQISFVDYCASNVDNRDTDHVTGHGTDRAGAGPWCGPGRAGPGKQRTETI